MHIHFLPPPSPSPSSLIWLSERVHSLWAWPSVCFGPGFRCVGRRLNAAFVVINLHKFTTRCEINSSSRLANCFQLPLLTPIRPPDWSLDWPTVFIAYSSRIHFVFMLQMLCNLIQIKVLIRMKM